MVKLIPKKETLSLLKDKLDGKIDISYQGIANMSGYSKRQLIRLSKQLEEKDIESSLIHGNIGRIAQNAANNTEMEFYKWLKNQYPNITIAQFKDYVDEDYIDNPLKQWKVKKYKLVKRSYSFFRDLFRKLKWRSPKKHRSISTKKVLHLIRDPMPRRGILIQIDGTPHDWFNNGKQYCLHMAVDDATSETLAGWFTKEECQYGYIKIMRLILEKYGIPLKLYSDKHTIFKANDGNYTQFGLMMKDLGIEMIYANTPEAKGRIERDNATFQGRLINDIKRFKIKSYDELNIWFNDFYIKYMNSKFSRIPKDPNDEFIPMLDNYNYDFLFSWRFERTINSNNMFSFDGYYYVPFNEETGEIIPIRRTIKVALRQSVETKEIRILRNNKWYPCKIMGKSIIGKKNKIISNQKELLQEMQDIIK